MRNKRCKIQKNFEEEKGITLISLVVTLIVLLILAGVSITTLTGSNGVIKKAQEARERSVISTESEAIMSAVKSIQINSNDSKNQLKEEIENQLGDSKGLELTDNENGSFFVKINDSNNTYLVESDGEVIQILKFIKIESEFDLKKFRDDVNSGNTYEGEYVYLTKDITLNLNEIWNPIGELADYSSEPYEEVNRRFKGIFDGKNHEINGINIETENKVQGLFGLVDNGKILNLKIGKNNNIKGGKATGAIVGYLYNNSTVSNCYNKADLNGEFTGGIVGCSYISSKILNCSNSGKVYGKEAAGGIAGKVLNNSSIENCFNTANIEGESKIGGIVGDTKEKSTVQKCYNTAEILGASFVGGIAGQNANNATIKICFNRGKVTGKSSNIGGLVGKNCISSSIVDCYNTGNIVASGNRIGGIIGYNQDGGSILNCYTTGEMTLSNVKNTGVIIGENSGKIGTKNIYYLSTIKGTTNSIQGVSSVSTEELKKLNTKLGSNWKKDTENKNTSFPILIWE